MSSQKTLMCTKMLQMRTTAVCMLFDVTNVLAICPALSPLASRQCVITAAIQGKVLPSITHKIAVSEP